MQTHNWRYVKKHIDKLETKKSRVEIEHYSIAYLYSITPFVVLQHRNSVKGGAHACKVDV